MRVSRSQDPMIPTGVFGNLLTSSLPDDRPFGRRRLQTSHSTTIAIFPNSKSGLNNLPDILTIWKDTLDQSRTVTNFVQWEVSITMWHSRSRVRIESRRSSSRSD